MTKTKEFYTARDDRVFKNIFINENDHTLMEALLSNVLDENVKMFLKRKKE